MSQYRPRERGWVRTHFSVEPWSHPLTQTVLTSYSGGLSTHRTMHWHKYFKDNPRSR